MGPYLDFFLFLLSLFLCILSFTNFEWAVTAPGCRYRDPSNKNDKLNIGQDVSVVRGETKVIDFFFSFFME